MARTREEWLKVIQEANSAENIVDEVMKLQDVCDLNDMMYRSVSNKLTKTNKVLQSIKGIIEIVEK